MKNIKVSIIIPVYNSEKYISNCLESILNQTHKNLDIILVNDGSNDNSVEIMKKFNNILIINKENGGVSSARNMGIEFIHNSYLLEFLSSKIHLINKSINSNLNWNLILRADFFDFYRMSGNEIYFQKSNILDFVYQKLKDSYIHFVDSDDCLIANCIENCVKIAKEHDACVIEHGISRVFQSITEKKIDYSPLRTVNNTFKIYSGLQILENYKFFLGFSWSTQGMFKASILNKNNIRYKHEFEYEDQLFGIMLMKDAKKVVKCNNNFYLYRIRSNSISNYTSLKEIYLPKYLLKFKDIFKDNVAIKHYKRSYCLAYTAYYIHLQLRTSLTQETYKKFLTVYTRSSLTNINPKKDPLNAFSFFKYFINDLNFIYRFFYRYNRTARFFLKIKHIIEGRWN